MVEDSLSFLRMNRERCAYLNQIEETVLWNLKVFCLSGPHQQTTASFNKTFNYKDTHRNLLKSRDASGILESIFSLELLSACLMDEVKAAGPAQMSEMQVEYGTLF